MDGDEPQPTWRVPFTLLGQVDSDFALAKALQEQERAFMMLGLNREDGSDNGDDEDSEGNDEDNEDDNDHDEEQDSLVEDFQEEDNEYQDIGQETELEDLSYEELIALGEVVGAESRGLTTDAITSLPSFTYKCQPLSDGSFKQCVICQIEYEEGKTLVILPCKHLYHSECLKEWLQINKVCPICGKEVASNIP